MIQFLPTLIPSSRVQYSITVPAPTEMLGRRRREERRGGGGGEEKSRRGEGEAGSRKGKERG